MAKTLHLVRHAKSDWFHPEVSDSDRPLNHRGERDAPEMGKRLKARGILPDIVLSSPACRARQTAEALCAELGLPAGTIVFEEEIYEATPSGLLKIVQSIDDSVGAALLVGHNPAITVLINRLAACAIGNAPTCSVATIELETPHWNQAGRCPAMLIEFDYPKRIRGKEPKR